MALAKTKKKKQRKKLFSPQGLHRRKIKRNSFSDLQVENFKKLLEHDAGIYSSIFQNCFDENLLPNPLIIGVDEVGRGCLAGPLCTGAYSCSSFYINSDDLIEEVLRSRQLVSSEFLNTNIRDAYYAETIINESSIEDDLDEVEELSALLCLEDSKKVAKAKRKTLCKSLLDVPCFGSESHILHSTNFQSAKKIDKNGIVKNIWESMMKNLCDILEQYMVLYRHSPSEVILLVDGPKTIPQIEKMLSKEFSKKKICDIRDINITQIAIIKGDSKSALIAAASNIAKLARDEYMTELSGKTRYENYVWANNVGYGTKKHLEAIMEHGITDEHRRSYLSNYLEN